MDELERLIEMAGIDEDNSNKNTRKAVYVLEKHGGVLNDQEIWAVEQYIKFLKKGDGYIRPFGGTSTDVPEQKTIDQAKTIVSYLSRV